MKLPFNVKNMPKYLNVNVSKGESGALLVEIPQLDLITEAENLNDLFFQVNDLIYTYFDIPKEFQDDLTYCPNREAREELINVAQQKTTTHKQKQFKINPRYSEELCRRIIGV